MSQANTVLSNLMFNLFVAKAPAEGKQAVLHRKGSNGNPDVPAEYIGSTRDEGIFKITGVKRVVEKEGSPIKGQSYYQITVVTKDADGKYHYYDGSLFVNGSKAAELAKPESERAPKAANWPDLNGTLTLDRESGTALRMSAWAKTGQQAGKYLSVNCEPQRPREDAAEDASVPADAQHTPATETEAAGGDLPF